MSYFGEVATGSPFPAFAVFRDHFGFVPRLFCSKSLLPRLIDAEAALVSSILFTDKRLTRPQRECVLLAVAAARGNPYCFSLHYQMLKVLGLSEKRLDRIAAGYEQSDLDPANKALLRFALRLAGQSSLSPEDVSDAASHGLTSEALLDAVLTTALADMLCVLSTGVGATPDFGFRPNALQKADDHADHFPVEEKLGLHLPAPELDPDNFEPFSWLQERFGFVPDVFRAQTLRADVLEAEVFTVRTILSPEDALTRVEKERILLAKGNSNEDATERDLALAGFANKLVAGEAEFSGADIQALRTQGFTEPQILEAVVTISFAGFFAVLQKGLDAAPDFARQWAFEAYEPKINPEKAHLSIPVPRHTDLDRSPDPDAGCVARVQGGDVNSFEELMSRHSRRVYRTLIGILGDPDDARDAMQDTFLKAFQHLADFEGRSKFSTWLLTIASNTGIQRLRERRPTESIEDSGSDDEDFRPRQIQSWTDDPEQLYSQAEMRSLIESGIMKLPAKYRVVLMLRDIEQLSMEDTATALGLSIAALKTRLLRGRLMLREALAPYFVAKGVMS
jgi:RNA polymerase sigma-70 factor, ECF subfamily